MCSFIKKFYDDNKKKFYLHEKFSCQIEILLLNIIILLKIQRFSRFPGKVATLKLPKDINSLS